MIVTEAEAAAHFCLKTEIRKDIPSETRPEMHDKANTPFLLADIGGSYSKLTLNNLMKIPVNFHLKSHLNLVCTWMERGWVGSYPVL